MTEILKSIFSSFIAAFILTGCSLPAKAPPAEPESSSRQSGSAVASSSLNVPAAPSKINQHSFPAPAVIARSRCSYDWGSPLLNAVADRRIEDIRALAAETDIRERTKKLSEALPLTLEWESTQCRAVRSDPEMLRLLLRLGADINARDQGERTFLMTALVHRNNQMARIGLDLGANPNSFSYHESPLIIAVRNGDQEAIKMLLASGAAVNLRVGAPDSVVHGALSTAARYPGLRNTVLKALITGGARYPARPDVQPLDEFASFYHGRPEDAEETLTLLLSLGAKINWSSSDGPTGMYSPLYLSVQSSRRSMEVIQALLRHGANPNQYVLYALGSDPYHGTEGLQRRDILELLFQNGARVSKTPKRGKDDVRSFILSNPTNREAAAYVRELDEMTEKYRDYRKPQEKSGNST